MGEQTHPQSATFALALKLLKARDRFESEIRGLLTTASSPISEIDEAISALRCLKFIDDERLARSTAERLSKKMWSRNKIAEHLEALGAPTMCVLELPPDPIVANQVAARSGSSGERLARRLVSLGFDEDLVRSVCDKE